MLARVKGLLYAKMLLLWHRKSRGFSKLRGRWDSPSATAAKPGLWELGAQPPQAVAGHMLSNSIHGCCSGGHVLLNVGTWVSRREKLGVLDLSSAHSFIRVHRELVSCNACSPASRASPLAGINRTDPQLWSSSLGDLHYMHGRLIIRMYYRLLRRPSLTGLVGFECKTHD
jgi:hypothetical protein